MLEDMYLHSIISNLGIAIIPENNSEIIIKTNIFYNEKNELYTLSDEYSIFYQDYGTIISDFQNTNFTDKGEFLNFFNKYSLFGLENKQINKLFSSKHCSVDKYNSFIEHTFKKYSKVLTSYQKDIDTILKYCIFKPISKTMALTPFQRLCILEYIPNTPTLLQENLIQTINLSSISDIENDSYNEDQLIEMLKTKKCRAYSNTLYIPNDIPSLLNFELTEIIKDNIILKICNYCKKYFIASNRHITYCNNIAPGNSTKTCRQVARSRKYLENFKKDEALALFTKVYNNKAYKASRYKDIVDYELDYKHFKEIGRKKLNNYKAKKITKEEFINWINRNK